MVRRRFTTDEQILKKTASAFSIACAPRKQKKTGSRVSTARISVGASRLENLVEVVGESIESGDWQSKSPALLVGLFCWAHTHVYGVSVIPELRRYYVSAVQAAKRLVENDFAGDFDKALEFVRWVWGRESDREEWRRKNTGFGSRITWRKVFVDKAFLVEWRLDISRKSGLK